jgi:hypothetical protein
MSEDEEREEEVSAEISEEKEGEESKEVEEVEEEFPRLSIQDIELLMKNTEIWDKLLDGKISIEDAKKIFEENYKEYEERDSRRKVKKSGGAKKTKKAKKKEKSV